MLAVLCHVHGLSRLWPQILAGVTILFMELGTEAGQLDSAHWPVLAKSKFSRRKRTMHPASLLCFASQKSPLSEVMQGLNYWNKVWGATLYYYSNKESPK